MPSQKIASNRQEEPFPQAHIAAVEFFLPNKRLTTEDLASEHPEWGVAAIDAKTGIRNRYVAAADQCASDLGFGAARKLFDSGACIPQKIDFLILCTQTPDYFLPTTACLLQDRLGIPTTAGALDLNLGCSGFVYGLGIAHGLISSGQAAVVLLITAETYSKLILPTNRAARTIFSDAGAATLIRAVTSTRRVMGPFIYGTDGRGASDLIVRGGAMRERSNPLDAEIRRSEDSGLLMNGTRLVAFALREIPIVIDTLIRRAGILERDVDLFVFHQANEYLLHQIRKAMRIPETKVYLCISEFGNTISSTIPISLKCAAQEGKLRDGSLVVAVGFGVGYSWAAALLRWTDFRVFEDSSN